MRKLLSLFLVLFFILTTQSQNLLNTNSWKIGSGSAHGFGRNGSTSENQREYGKNHLGKKVVLWKAIPDKAKNADGGWNASAIKVNYTKTYRLTVWLKKTNSNDGYSYFGCGGRVLNLSGKANSNPYFWQGDLPKLNRWYLIVGFIHGSGYKSKVSKGAIYDGVTGEKVKTITDFKFKSGAKFTRHRSYLFYDTNTKDRQYFYAPRLEMVTGKEPSIDKLMGINRGSKLIISYDIANNRNQTFYCANSSHCSPSKARKARDKKEVLDKYRKENSTTTVIETDDKMKLLDSDNTKNQLREKYNIFVYPNPTAGITTIDISKIRKKITSIRLYNSNSKFLRELNFKNVKSFELDLSDKATGIYILHIQTKEGKSITKKIIKK